MTSLSSIIQRNRPTRIINTCAPSHACSDCNDKEERDERKRSLLMKTSSSARSVLHVPDVMLLSAGSSRSNGPSQPLWAVYKQPTQSERRREGEEEWG